MPTKMKEKLTPWFVRAGVKEVKSVKANVVALFGPHKFRRLVRSTKGIDLFGFSPVVQFNSFQTFFGGFFSLVCITAVIIYILVTANRFLNNPVSKSQVSLEMDSDGVITPFIGFKFMQDNGTVLNDPTYFQFKVSTVVVTNSSLATRVFTDIPLTTCNFWREIDDPDSLIGKGDPVDTNVPCITQASINEHVPRLVGIFEAPRFVYLQLDVFRCQNNTVNDSSIVCKDPSVIDNIATRGDMITMWYNREVLDVFGVDAKMKIKLNWRSYRWKLPSGLSTNYDIFMTKAKITHISAWPLGKEDKVETLREERIIDTYSSITSRGRYHKFIWRSSLFKSAEEWKPQLFFDLVGSWGAFWSSLLLIFGTFAILYNSKKWHFLIEEEAELDENGVIRARGTNEILYDPGDPGELQVLTKTITKRERRNKPPAPIVNNMIAPGDV